jgi:hypothetical protein
MPDLDGMLRFLSRLSMQEMVRRSFAQEFVLMSFVDPVRARPYDLLIQ